MSNGIPSLLNGVAKITNTFALLNADAALILGMFNSTQQWGIFANGQAAILFDAVVSVEIKKDYSISNYPQENGAFQSYNKVQMPFDARLRITKGGTQSEKTTFLTALDKIVAGLDLYDVTTPEYSYHNANIVHYDYRRNAENGAGLLTVDIWLIEVRNTATISYTTTGKVTAPSVPSGSSVVSSGIASTQYPSTAQAIQAAGKVS
jgi:hypothetical protein